VEQTREKASPVSNLVEGETAVQSHAQLAVPIVGKHIREDTGIDSTAGKEAVVNGENCTQLAMHKAGERTRFCSGTVSNLVVDIVVVHERTRTVLATRTVGEHIRPVADT
jgi:hypothetical protein